jgi:protein required for attachment to host cells
LTNFPLTWVLVAGSTRARLFQWTVANGELEELPALVNPEGRLRESALTSDRAGYTFSSHGRGGRHPMMPAHSAQDNAANTFAHEVAAQLRNALDQNKYQRLVLVAPPGFLGRLRPQLDERVRKKVVASLDLDLTRDTPDAIRARLPLSYSGA